MGCTTEPELVKKIYCEVCGKSQPVIEEELKKDELNEHAWGDLVCGVCHLVIATISLEPE